MKILQMVSSSATSGAEKHVVVLSERLMRRGHEVTILCPPGGWLPEQLRAAGLPVREMMMHGARSLATALQMTRFVREEKIDLIHTHLTCATYHGVLVGSLASLPVVSSVHIQSRDLVYRRLLPRQRNRIITVSDFIRDALIRYGIPASRLHTIHNGTDFCTDEIESEAEGCAASKAEGELPVRAELSLPPDAELIGLFGRVNEFKGHFLLAEAASAVVAARPRAYFVCVGAVAPAIQHRLWEIASAGGMAERLRFTGVRNDVKRLMSAMDVVTLPSRYEACSMSIIEAMAMGKPVVATRAGGNPELVEDQETGLLIERNPSALAEGLVAVLSDAARRTRMGEAALLRARTHFTASVMTSHIERLYQEILERPPAA